MAGSSRIVCVLDVFATVKRYLVMDKPYGE